MNDKIKEDLVSAMKNHDKFTTSVLRMLKSAIQTETINKKHDLSNEEVIAVIKKQVKVRESSKEEYKKYNKIDLVNDLQKEIDILSVYLPEELNEDEINKIIDDTIKEIDAKTIKDMGRVIKMVAQNYGNRVDMGKVSTIVKAKLS